MEQEITNIKCVSFIIIASSSKQDHSIHEFQEKSTSKIDFECSQQSQSQFSRQGYEYINKSVTRNKSNSRINISNDIPKSNHTYINKEKYTEQQEQIKILIKEQLKTHEIQQIIAESSVIRHNFIMREDLTQLKSKVLKIEDEFTNMDQQGSNYKNYKLIELQKVISNFQSLKKDIQADLQIIVEFQSQLETKMRQIYAETQQIKLFISEQKSINSKINQKVKIFDSTSCKNPTQDLAFQNDGIVHFSQMKKNYCTNYTPIQQQNSTPSSSSPSVKQINPLPPSTQSQKKSLNSNRQSLAKFRQSIAGIKLDNDMLLDEYLMAQQMYSCNLLQ